MRNIIHLEETDSTNTWIKQRRSELPDGTLVTSDRQTAGKGRMGHTWLDDRGMLPMSVLLKDPPHPTEITLCAAVAVCRALEASYTDSKPKFGIKWPNDIVLDGYKLCGILCESACFGDRIDIICGIGINLSQSAEYFMQAGLPHGASLKMLTGSAPERENLAQRIADILTELCAAGFLPVIDEYRSRCVTLGKEVRLIHGGSEQTAFAKDIAENGFLICSTASGEFEVNSGEVSVRGLYGYA
ncbi:MAG: biotin--[acetyl-CoA-carboxylase] ligase [Oscillospiraceae bacterium]